eukprot:SAG22_NODE_458_length_10257_cov_4.533373_7_plen_1069_part_00
MRSKPHARLETNDVGADKIDPESDLCCLQLRGRLHTDVEITSLLVMIRKVGPESIRVLPVIERLFENTLGFFPGVSYIKHIVETRADPSTIDDLSLAQALSHIGFTGSDISIITIEKVQVFVDRWVGANDDAWIWPTISKMKKLQLGHVAQLCIDIGVVWTRVPGIPDPKLVHFICDAIKMPNDEFKFWATVERSIRTSPATLQDHSGVLSNTIDYPRAWRQFSAEKKDVLDEFLIMVYIVREFLDALRSVKHCVTRRDWKSLVASTPARSPNASRSPHEANMVAFGSTLRAFIRERSRSHIWQKWIECVDISSAFKSVKDAYIDNDSPIIWTLCEDFTAAMQAIGFTGSLGELAPIVTCIESEIQRPDPEIVAVEESNDMKRANAKDRIEFCISLICFAQEWKHVEDLLSWIRRDDNMRMRLFKRLSSPSYKVFNTVVSLVHISLVFWEAPSSNYGLRADQEEELSQRFDLLVGVSGFCICQYIVDLGLTLLLYGTTFYETASTPQPTIGAMTHISQVPEKPCFRFDGTRDKRKSWWMIFWIVSVSLIALDWYIQVMMGAKYATQSSNISSEDMVLLLPYSALLRPIVLCIRGGSLRTGLRLYVSVLCHSYDVFLLLMLCLLWISICATVLPIRDPEDPDSESRFSTLTATISTLFIYMSTAENYPDVVWPPTLCDGDTAGDNTFINGHISGGCERWVLHVFFMAASILGSMVLISLTIATFESKFSRAHRNHLSFVKTRKIKALVAAFLVLDSFCLNQASACGKGLVGIKELVRLLRGIGLATKVKIANVAQAKRMQYDVDEFVALCEQLGLMSYGFRASALDDKLFADETPEEQPHALPIEQVALTADVEATAEPHVDDAESPRQRCSISSEHWESIFHRYVIAIVSMIQLWALLGISPNSGTDRQAVEFAFWLVFGYYKIELLLRLVTANRGSGSSRCCGGCAQAWKFFWFVPESFFVQSKNRFDFIVSSSATIVALIWCFFGTSSENQDAWFNAVFVVEGMRIFSSVESIRVLFFSMVAILPNFYAMFLILLMMFYFFGVVGCWLLAGKLKYVDEAVYEMPRK